MLAGKSVSLRAVEKDDLELIREWITDPDLLHQLGARPVPLGSIDPEKLPDLFRLRDGRVLAILNRDRHLIGLVAFGNGHEQNRTASLMIVVGDRGEWNRGYGSDALRTALHFAFDELNLNCVEAHVPAFNQRALRVFQKVGFVVEGSLRSRFFGRGKYHDVTVLSALREGWTGNKPAAAASTAVVESAAVGAAPAANAAPAPSAWAPPAPPSIPGYGRTEGGL